MFVLYLENTIILMTINLGTSPLKGVNPGV